MAEEQDGLSKRERQKARRQARRQEELAQARRQEVTGRTLRVVGILVVLGLLGYLVGNWVMDRREEARLKEEALASLEELGCTPDAQQPDQGAGHIEDFSAVPPEVAYPDRPATSGPHIGTVAKSGVYDEVVDERLLVHNLEHGYVNIYFADDAPADQVEALQEWARERIDGRNPKMIVAPQHGEWSDPDKNFALVAWRYRQMCETWDPGVALAFMDAHYGLAGIAPEKSVPPHMGGQGVLDPEDTEGPLLFPPLDGSGADGGEASPEAAEEAETEPPAEATEDAAAG